MYAVVSTGGKQVKVEKGAEAVVEKLDAAVGDTVTLDVIFVADGDNVVTDAAALSSASVTAQVVEHFKDDKVVIFKFKKRKGYKRLKGHRQPLTRLLITDIATSGKPAAKKAAKAEAEPAAEKPKRAAKPKAEAETAPVAEATVVETAPAEEKPKRAAKPKAAKAETAEATAEAAPAEEKPKRTRAKKVAEAEPADAENADSGE